MAGNILLQPIHLGLVHFLLPLQPGLLVSNPLLEFAVLKDEQLEELAALVMGFLQQESGWC